MYMEAACMDMCKADTEIRNFGWWRQGWQRWGQFLRNIRMKVQNLATCLGRKGRSCCRVSWGLEGRDTKALTDRDHTWRADKWEGQNAGKLGFCFLHRAGVGKARGEVIMIGRGNGKPRSTFDTLAPCLPSFLPYSAWIHGAWSCFFVPMATQNGEGHLVTAVSQQSSPR